MGCKRSLVLEMEVRVSVYLIIIIIIRPDIAINDLMGRKAIFNQSTIMQMYDRSQFNACCMMLNILTLLTYKCHLTTHIIVYEFHCALCNYTATRSAHLCTHMISHHTHDYQYCCHHFQK